MFTKVTINIPAYENVRAKQLVIEAPENSQQNIFVRRLRLNNRTVDLKQPMVSQSELLALDSNVLTF